MKTVFVFGAGASYGWGVEGKILPPISDSFFSSTRERIQLQPTGFDIRWPSFAALKKLYQLPDKLTSVKLLKKGYFDKINLEDAATRSYLAKEQGLKEGKKYYEDAYNFIPCPFLRP